MAITHKEKPTSRKGQVKFNDPSTTLEFWVHGTSNENLLVAYVNNMLPTTYTINGQTLWFDHYTYEAYPNATWTVTAHYKKNGNSSELVIKSGGGHAKRYQSLETVNWYNCVEPLLDPPDFQKAINVTEHGCEGVDMPVRKFEFSISKRISVGSMPGDYLMTLFELQNCVNVNDYTIAYNGMILTFLKGTLLFTGFPLKFTSEYSMDITYEFAAEHGIWAHDELTIGDSDFIEKEGWEYLWVHYREQVDAGYTIKRPIGAYVERVFEYADFSWFII